MRALLIKNGIVENAIVADESFSLDGFDVVFSDTAGVGWRYENGDFLPPEIPAPLALSKRIAALTTQYKSDVQAMQLSWLASSVVGGALESGKKEDILLDIADRKVQYMADVAAEKLV